ncbi:hypothetical protein [Prauserella muralis]|uniref:Uncharacterized protein n=1 Tax=Prauserella muralis TaxID=588067 RepID=A0A2V4B8D5_9PSEU|nr:hypothetical protein [Prauserella muralis]PXY31624.1 hypothetical protein BAY60_04455 [Prauserella muralis]TWE14011.1 hypothetical protein FHX69_6145 [Prauserella muralis]
MRITATALARKALTTAAVAAVVTGSAVLGAGTASATTLQADSCTASVTGRIGDTVAVPGATVKDLVRQGAREAKSIFLVHDITIWPDHLANEVAKEQLTVGTVPNAQRAVVAGDVVGAAVRQALKDEAGLGALPSTQETTLNKIAAKVAGYCGLPVFAANYVAPSSPSQPPPSTGHPGGTPAPRTGGSPAGTDAGPGGVAGTGDARVAPRDYTGIPTATAPAAGISAPPGLRYPPSSGVPGQPSSPEFGILGADGAGEGSGGGQSADVRNAGNADALAAGPSASAVQLPMLLAVVALAGVTAALVRTWVLRRVS